MQHPGELHVGRELRLAACALHAVDAWNLAADDLERPSGPLVDRILVDDDPLLGVLPFDFLLGANQSRHVLMASSILG